MALTVNNYTQEALVNPFQQRNNEARVTEQKKPQENRTQPREAAAAGAQATETRNARRAEFAEDADKKSESRTDSRRGSNVDITV